VAANCDFKFPPTGLKRQINVPAVKNIVNKKVIPKYFLKRESFHPSLLRRKIFRNATLSEVMMQQF
jgi:hypothetical protein